MNNTLHHLHAATAAAHLHGFSLAALHDSMGAHVSALSALADLLAGAHDLPLDTNNLCFLIRTVEDALQADLALLAAAI